MRSPQPVNPTDPAAAGPARVEYRQPGRPGRYLVRPHHGTGAALLGVAIVGYAGVIVGVAGRMNEPWAQVTFAVGHGVAAALAGAAHLLSRWPPDGGVEPVWVALVRWLAQAAMRVLVVLSIMFLVDGPPAAGLWCVGVMLAHDGIVIAERVRAGALLGE